MQKKNWIYIKRGLSEDPKHRERIGQAIWCFMHIIDRADWETGLVYDWRDKDEAADMQVNPRTLRDWRQNLEKANYISCQQTLHGQNITIYNWKNPRNYSGELLNPFPTTPHIQDEEEIHGDKKTAPLEVHGDTHGDTHVGRKGVTLPLDSKSYTSKKKKGDLVDAMIDFAQMPGAKKAIRLEGMQALIKKRLGINPTGRKWEEFLRHADKNHQEEGQDLNTFIDWLTSQKGFDVSFWPPEKMQQHWPRAFSNNGTAPRPPLVRAPEIEIPFVSTDLLIKK